MRLFWEEPKGDGEVAVCKLHNRRQILISLQVTPCFCPLILVGLKYIILHRGL